MENKFKYTSDNKRYHTLTYYYKEKFNSKVCKVSLNANFTCPNIDGKVGIGGCIYCSKLGSGEYAGNPKEDLITQFEKGKKTMQRKWPNAKFIAYFQANTNTYAPIERLKECFEPFINRDDCIGLSIATRSDSITDECLDYLEDISKRTYLIVELGLQTIHEKTSKLINRCSSLVLKDTPLEKYYQKHKFHILTKEEYVNIVVKQLEYLNPKIVIHRLTEDPKQEDIIEPTWLTKKFTILNEVDKIMSTRNLYQGDKLKEKMINE